VIDDYAHHPTEVAATLAAARSALGRRLTVIFQPHLYSRTQLLMAQFARAFREADSIVVTDIYGARENPLPGVDARTLAEEIARNERGKPVEYIASKAAIVAHLLETARPGDAVLTMGAGDIREVGESLVRALQPRANDRIEAVTRP